MWERTLSQKSVRLFCEQKVIDEAKADAYVYGYELLISSVVSVLLVVLIAVVCGDVRYALSFLIGFIPQRIYIGGYHATSHTKMCIRDRLSALHDAIPQRLRSNLFCISINNNQEGDNKSCHPLDCYLFFPRFSFLSDIYNLELV